MSTHLLALYMMAAQGCLGGFDTIYHHELTEALPLRAGAAKELAIHAIRASIYSLLFIGLACWEWHGAWSLVLLAVFGVEIVLTLWDFVVEDRSRLLPASERVTHTVLAMNGGAFVCLLTLDALRSYSLPSALVWQAQGWLSGFLVLCGVGVGLSGLRDALAALRSRKWERREAEQETVDFGPRGQQVLVTGATGFIGSLLVKQLLRSGQQVCVLTRRPRQAAWQFDGKVVCIGSIDELSAQRRIDFVVNLAGARILGWRWNAARKAELRKSRVQLTQDLVRWIARAEYKPRLFLSASAIGYYGIQARGDERELDEDGPPQAIFMSQLCQEWERAAREAGKHGITVATMRFGLVLGRQGALPMMLLPVKLGLGGALGGGQQWLSWIHVHDLLRGIGYLSALHADGKPLHAAYNFCAPQSLPQLEFHRTAARVLHRPCFLPTPAWPMRLLLGEQADLLLEGQRVAPSQLLRSGFEFRYGRLEQALADLCR